MKYQDEAVPFGPAIISPQWHEREDSNSPPLVLESHVKAVILYRRVRLQNHLLTTVTANWAGNTG